MSLGELFEKDWQELESEGILFTSLTKLVAWGRSNSLWPVTFGLACCAIEMISASMARFDLSERFGEQTPEGLRVAHDLTQEELAQLVGASRETVNKSLADFISRGWIRLEGRAVQILDLERLKRRAR